MRVDRPRALVRALGSGRVRILQPGVLPVLLLHTSVDDVPDEALAGEDAARLLGVYRVLHPVLLVQLYPIAGEGLYGPEDDLLDHGLVAVGLLQLGGGDPDLPVGGDVLPSLVQ